MLSLTPMLQSGDLARTEAWYAETLGFACVGRAADWLRLARDGAALMFMRNDHLGPPAATATQYIVVDDLAALWDSLRDRAPVAWGPAIMPYGMHEFAVRDPDGYLISFGEPVAATAEY